MPLPMDSQRFTGRSRSRLTRTVMLEFSQVSKRFGARAALRDITLSRPVGSTLMLLGPSGCGKSTLLRLALGLLQPDAGTVRFDGQDLRTADSMTVRHRCGYLHQDGRLFPHLNAFDNVTLVPRNLGWSPERRRARFQELLEFVNLPTDIGGRMPDDLSGGQRQRVALMRALVLDPDVLLLDEPLAALDPIARHALQLELRQWVSLVNKTVLWVTHDLSEAATLNADIALLEAGRIVQQGSLIELLDAPVDDFARQFVASQRGPREILETGA